MRTSSLSVRKQKIAYARSLYVLKCAMNDFLSAAFVFYICCVIFSMLLIVGAQRVSKYFKLLRIELRNNLREFF